MRRFAPVRRSIPLADRDWRYGSERLAETFAGYKIYTAGSGTQALAAAIAHVVKANGPEQREVVLPAYGCPDLVAACEHAGARPVLVEIDGTSWGYSLPMLEQSLSKRTCAVIAVNLLGVGDQSDQIAAITKSRGIRLIQDSAQHLPDGLDHRWRGNYIILSFGRGKPLNLLTGGAVLIENDLDSRESMDGLFKPARTTLLERIPYADAMKSIAFNVLTSPQIYGLVSRLPGLGIGATKYHPVSEVYRMSRKFNDRLSSAYASFNPVHDYAADRWLNLLPQWEISGVRLLRVAGQSAIPRHFLRFPLLASSHKQRDYIVRVLDSSGIGASPMYSASLNNLDGVPPSISTQGPFPVSTRFAERFFTLPTYSLVDAAVAERVNAVISDSQRWKML